MQLVMYIGNDFITAVSVNDDQIAQPGYIGKIKRHMKIDYQHLLEESNERAEFLVIESFGIQEQVSV